MMKEYEQCEYSDLSIERADVIVYNFERMVKVNRIIAKSNATFQRRTGRNEEYDRIMQEYHALIETHITTLSNNR